jgi:hypothetical protein
MLPTPNTRRRNGQLEFTLKVAQPGKCLEMFFAPPISGWRISLWVKASHRISSRRPTGAHVPCIPKARNRPSPRRFKGLTLVLERNIVRCRPPRFNWSAPWVVNMKSSEKHLTDLSYGSSQSKISKPLSNASKPCLQKNLVSTVYGIPRSTNSSTLLQDQLSVRDRRGISNALKSRARA